jgi:hypothetical protein
MAPGKAPPIFGSQKIGEELSGQRPGVNTERGDQKNFMAPHH